MHSESISFALSVGMVKDIKRELSFRFLDTIADRGIRSANKSYFSNFSAPSVQIVDALGEPLRDKYYEADSTIELLCVVRHIAMQVQYSVVQWLHGNRVLNYDTTRGGIR